MDDTSAVTIKDVAELAKVSVATVSRVLNNNPSVKPSARKSVERAVRELSYTAQRSSRKPRSQIRRIGLLVPDIAEPFYPNFIKGIANIAVRHNVELILCDCSRDPSIESGYITSLTKNRVDAIISTPFTEKLNPLTERLIEERFPVVLLLEREADRNDMCVVTTDDEEGAYHATKYLLDLGHRDIAFLTIPLHIGATASRTRGIRNALADSGLELTPRMIHACDGTYEGTYRQVAELWSRSRFTAAFAFSDQMALGAWKAIEDGGARIPDDVSIIGYNDISFSWFISLTTIAQSVEEIGKNALSLAIDLIEGTRTPPQKIVLRDSLIIRRSCKKI